MKLKLCIALISLLAVGATANAAHHPQHAGQAPAATAAMSEGEVRKIDKDAGKITLKHGEIKNLGMPPMTMVFRVKDPTLLDQVKVGDKVQFVAEKAGGQYTVTGIERKN